jgi:hypothetical protein
MRHLSLQPLYVLVRREGQRAADAFFARTGFMAPIPEKSRWLLTAEFSLVLSRLRDA